MLEPEKTEKPIHHVCTSALLCPFYRILKGLAGISVQLGGSILGLFINLLLLLGVFHSASWALLIWLLAYIFATCGCLILFAVVLNVLITRLFIYSTNCLSLVYIDRVPYFYYKLEILFSYLMLTSSTKYSLF